MLFNSLAYALFLPTVFGVYWWLGNKKQGLRWQNFFLLAASYLFYGWWDARFLILIVVSSGADFILSGQMAKRKQQRDRRPFLIGSLVLNLGLLGFFKYFGFFTESFAALLRSFGVQADGPALDILLPVGISFYTFQTLSYSIDVYRGKLQPTRDGIAFFAYVAFFPQLIAGPIEKARDLLPQFQMPRSFNYPLAVSGLRLILYGIVKKVVIADRLAEYVNPVFLADSPFEGLDIVLATTFFAIQIYCDFSGYSDIAIGTARLLGFQLTINFRTPFFAQSVAEFWRRWHITLNAWFRDYVYTPLGGRRKGEARTFLNILLVFLISGFWHGPAWTYIYWGAICAWFYLMEGALGFGNQKYAGWRRIVASVYAFSAFSFGMLFFRSESLQDAFVKLIASTSFANMEVTLFNLPTALSEFMSPLAIVLYLAALLLLFIFLEAKIGLGSLDEVLAKWPKSMRWAFYYTLIALLLLMGTYGIPEQFIYFQF